MTCSDRLDIGEERDCEAQLGLVATLQRFGDFLELHLYSTAIVLYLKEFGATVLD